jgi:type IV pilus assembly protein PilA
MEGRKPRHGDDAGFSLVELLVVIVILGILAAVAIPVYLHQRLQAYDAQAKSDLHSLALAEESYLADHNAYTTSLKQLAKEGAETSPAVTDSVRGVKGSSSYCLRSVSPSGTTWYLGSVTGGPRTGSCTKS